jgi:hypothetical protein
MAKFTFMATRLAPSDQGSYTLTQTASPTWVAAVRAGRERLRTASLATPEFAADQGAKMGNAGPLLEQGGVAAGTGRGAVGACVESKRPGKPRHWGTRKD